MCVQKEFRCIWGHSTMGRHTLGAQQWCMFSFSLDKVPLPLSLTQLLKLLSDSRSLLPKPQGLCSLWQRQWQRQDQVTTKSFPSLVWRAQLNYVF